MARQCGGHRRQHASAGTRQFQRHTDLRADPEPFANSAQLLSIENLVARYGKYIFFRPSLYGRLTNAYRSNHFWVTLIGQTLPTVRIYLALPAGVLKLEPRAFLAATSLGTLIWNMPFLSLGYALRGSGHDPVSIGFWVAVVLIAAEFAILLGFRFCKRPVAHSPGITAGERNGGI